jgi:proliferating cell nuclear antigen
LVILKKKRRKKKLAQKQLGSFHLKAKSVETLKQLVSVINVLAAEVPLELNENRIHVRVMDPSRVAMIDAAWPKTIFEEYNCLAPIRVGVNLGELLKLLRRGSKNDSVDLDWSSETAKFKVSIKNTSGNNASSRNFTLPSLNVDEDQVPEPKLSFNAKAKMVASTFQQVMNDVDIVSDHVRLEVKANQMQVIGQGDLMAATITLSKEQGLLELESTTEAQATYSNAFIGSIVKAVSTDSLVTLELSTDMPVKLSIMGLLDTQDKDAHIIFFIAPRIETE